MGLWPGRCSWSSIACRVRVIGAKKQKIGVSSLMKLYVS